MPVGSEKRFTVKILVLGTGCARCAQTERVVREVAEASGKAAVVENVTDLMVMMRLRVMSTPAVVVDGKVVCSGRVPSAEEVRAWIEDASAAAGEGVPQALGS